MKLLTALVLFAAVASAQNTPANPLTLVSKNIYAMAKKNILGSVDKVPEEMWSYQPTKEVRTFAELFAHIADGQYEFCGVASEGKSVMKGIEKTSKTKAEIVPALKESIRLGESSKPTMIVAHTIKGKGISFTEGKFVWHSKVATEAELQTARTELQIEEVK